MDKEKYEKRVVSVDVGKDILCVYWDGLGAPQEYKNEQKTLKALAKEIEKKVNPTLVVMEATGGYENLLCEVLWIANIPLAKANPGRIKHFRQAKGYHAKTDKIDAMAIYEFAMAIDLEELKAPSEGILKVRKLVLRKEQLIKMKVMETNHLKAPMNDKNTEKSIKNILKFLEKEIKDVSNQITELLKGLSEEQAKIKVLRKEKGVGVVLLGALISLLPELGTLNRNSIASLVGVAPFNNDSGDSTGKRSIRGGRFILRQLIYMATLSVVRHNGTIKKFYQQLLKNGKCKKAALVAAMRKFVIRLNTVAREAMITDPLNSTVTG